MPERLSDETLLAQLAQGDERALAALARRHAAWLVNAMLGHTESLDIAEDVVQDVFVHLWESRETLNSRHTNVRALLYRASRNRAIDVMRKERAIRARVLPNEYTESSDSDPSDASRLTDAINRALMTLQARTREIFVLRAQHGMEITTIAESLGVSVGTVYTQLYRATKQLAQHPDLIRLWSDPE